MKIMKLDKFSLNGKNALITGAAGLLGLEHASALLEVGCSVVLTDINSTELSEKKDFLIKKYPNSMVITKVMDVTNFQNIYDTFQELSVENIIIDILINNAAIDPKVKNDSLEFSSSRVETFKLKRWEDEIAVGLTGAFLCCKVFGGNMAENGKGGVILNISSDLSVISPDNRLYIKKELNEKEQEVKPVTYSVIKTGLVGLTRYLSTYWADKGVRCNALSPGGVEESQGEDFKRKLEALIPLKRMAKKDEYRSAIQFLCSDASSYMTGQNIVMDGGRSVW